MSSGLSQLQGYVCIHGLLSIFAVGCAIIWTYQDKLQPCRCKDDLRIGLSYESGALSASPALQIPGFIWWLSSIAGSSRVLQIDAPALGHQRGSQQVAAHGGDLSACLRVKLSPAESFLLYLQGFNVMPC